MRESDQAEIRDVARRWEEAWNSHDMAAMATLLAPDADFVNVSGRHWKGRQEIGASTHSVKPDALHPRARPRRVDAFQRDGIFSWLMVRDAAAWRIRSAPNTNMVFQVR